MFQVELLEFKRQEEMHLVQQLHHQHQDQLQELRQSVSSQIRKVTKLVLQ